MEDITLQCVDCHNDFTVTKGEQDFFKSKGFELPKRCKECRFKRKQLKSQGGDR